MTARAATRPTALSGARRRVAAIAVMIVLAAVVVVVAVQIGRRSSPSTRSSGPAPQPGMQGAPDISAMSPQEQAARLYGRVMRLHEEQKTDSVAFFAPMALGAYGAIANMNLDQRYDVARIAMVAGALPVARAQDDTILRRDSTHLLGLLLGADLARAANDTTRAKRLEATFVAVAPRERKRNLAEYQAHAAEIESAIKRLAPPKG